jgi:hypothetical protein
VLNEGEAQEEATLLFGVPLRRTKWHGPLKQILSLTIFAGKIVIQSIVFQHQQALWNLRLLIDQSWLTHGKGTFVRCSHAQMD